jgi:hypothetical protein
LPGPAVAVKLGFTDSELAAIMQDNAAELLAGSQ